MKKIRSLTALFLSCLLLAGCGGQKDNAEGTWRGIQAGMDDLSAITERTEYYDIVIDQEPLFQWEQEGEDSPLSIKYAGFVNMQFYQGEPVQLWRKPNFGSVDELLSWDIVLYRHDGNRETVLQGISSAYGHHGYLDQEGNFYWWKNSGTTEHSNGTTENTDTSLKKYSPSGELLFERQYGYGYDFSTIRQTADGRIYLIVRNKEWGGEGSRRLAELDPETGLITEHTTVKMVTTAMDSQYLGVWGDKLATLKAQVMSGNQVTAIDMTDGTEACILSLKGTSYVPPDGFSIQDLRILEDESVEILWSSGNGSKSLRERLWMAKVERTPIVLRARNTEGWLTDQVNSFNRQSETYHVVVEDCGLGNDAEDFARLTSIQLASGKGPDIIYSSLMKDYMPGLMEKGALEDLRPYMERSGIRQEDYFPFTFGTWKNGDGIYGVSPASPVLAGYCMDSTFLGSTQEPDIETLIDALLSSQEKAVFLKGYDSQELLELFLAGTDTLWGMVDWEKRSCDFSGNLFAQILEAAKRYGDREDTEAVSCLAKQRSFADIFDFDDAAERKNKGTVICGTLFDDGCHVAVTSYSALAVNVNSPHKEGAWEFISFLLGETAQSASSGIPASRSAFGSWVEKQKARVAGGKSLHKLHTKKLPDGSRVITGETIYTEADITDEIIAEFRETLEDARPYPLRTVPILDIIRDEAADYFSGSKSAGEAARLVTNRVQTYLDEGR